MSLKATGQIIKSDVKERSDYQVICIRIKILDNADPQYYVAKSERSDA